MGTCRAVVRTVVALVGLVVADGCRTPVQAQQYRRADADTSILVTAGREYAAGALHRFVLGEHHRDVWTTPIRVPTLDLSTFAGGLTPLQAHTGSQTVSLRLEGADGRTYQFRSVHKTPANMLPEHLRNTVVADLLRDGASSSHPLGALVVSRLLTATGVLHAPPVLAVMPDDSVLGVHREAFAGMLGLLQERPDEGGEDRGGFAGAAKVVSPGRLFERLDESPADRVDARAFLAARLVDILVGDRDRHRDNWRWALLDAEAPVRRWVPVSRDHDEAFVKHDGLALRLAAPYRPELVRFGPEYDRTLNLNWHAREVDRRFLAELQRPVWDSTVVWLQARLSDEVIDRAVRALPPAAHAVDGAELAHALKRRRDALPEEVDRYYRLLAEEVELRGTDAPEEARIVRVDDRFLDVTIAPRGGGEPLVHRRFDAAETREVRIRLWGGRDRAVVTGEGAVPIGIRVVGGKGRDVLIDSSRAGGASFYDAGARTTFEAGRGSTLGRKPYEEWVGSDLDRYPPREWGSSVRPFPRLQVDPDHGVLLGGGVTRTRYGFRKEPYASRVSLVAALASGEGWGEVAAHGDFRREGSPVHVSVDASVSGVELLNWFGMGNDSPRLPGRGAHEVDVDALRLESRLLLPLGARAEAEVGAFAAHTSTRGEEGTTFFDAVRDTLYGAGGFLRMGLTAAAEVDTRDRSVAPSRGVLLRASVRAVPPLAHVEETYARLDGEARAYLTGGSLAGEPTLALRVAGARLFGRFPFQDAAFLGGRHDLRGWQRERFAGDASLHGSAEVRLLVRRFRWALPGELGVYGLADVGRVWVDGASVRGAGLPVLIGGRAQAGARSASHARTTSRKRSCSSTNGKWPLRSSTTWVVSGMPASSRAPPCSGGIIQSCRPDTTSVGAPIAPRRSRRSVRGRQRVFAWSNAAARATRSRVSASPRAASQRWK